MIKRYLEFIKESKLLKAKPLDSKVLASNLDIPLQMATHYNTSLRHLIYNEKMTDPKILHNEFWNIIHTDIEELSNKRKYNRFCKDFRFDMQQEDFIHNLKKLLNAKIEKLVSIEQDKHWMDKLSNVVWKSGDFCITLDSLTNLKYIVCWCDGEQIGFLDTRGYQTRGDKKYILIDGITLEKNYRGKGLGFQMYKCLLDYCGVDGIISYQPDRINNKQVPAIYKRLGNFIEDGDYWIVNK